MFPIPESYSSKSICLEPSSAPNPNTKLNRKFDLTQIPQALIDIANTYLTFREKALFRSAAKYFNQIRPIETLDLLEEPLPDRVLSQDLFKHYTNIRQLNVSFANADLFNIRLFLQNPKFSTIQKLYLMDFFINERREFGPNTDYIIAASSYLSAFQNLTDLTLVGNGFDLYPLAPLIHLQRLKIVGHGFYMDWEPLSNLTQLTELTLNQSLIVDLKHLSGLVNLTHLDLSDNKNLIVIDTISNLTNLKFLSLAKCKKVTKIEHLITLRNLEHLNLSGINQSLIGRVSVNPTAIAYMPLLQTLNLNFENDYPDLKYLSHLTDLTDLSLNIGLVMDFSPLLNLTQLQKLACRNPEGNEFPDYAPIFQISSLTELHMIGSLNRLPEDIQLPQLRILDLRDNKDLTEIQELRTLTRLEILDLSYTKVSDLEPLSQLVQLRYFSITPFFGKPEPLANLRNLRLLDISGKEIDLEILLNSMHLEYLSVNHHRFKCVHEEEVLLKFSNLKGICKTYFNTNNPKIKPLLKNDIFSEYDHQLFPMLRSIGVYP